MSHTFVLSDEQYKIIEDVAASEGRTPEDLFLAWALDQETRYRQEHPTYYETDDWLRHLGVSNKEIEASKERVRQEGEMSYDADA